MNKPLLLLFCLYGMHLGAMNVTPLITELKKEPISLYAVQKLIESNADINEESAGSTPLSLACFRGNIEASRLLIKAGADTATESSSCFTPLLAAVCPLGSYAQVPDRSNATPAIVQLLLDHGADPNQANKLDQRPLLFFASLPRICIEPDETACHDTPAIKKAGARMAHVAELLISHNVSLDETQFGDTALMLAASEGYTPLVKKLIEAQAQLETKNSCNLTALSHAAKKGFVDTMEALIQGGALVTITQLEHAAQAGQAAACRKLIDHNPELIKAIKAGEEGLFTGLYYNDCPELFALFISVGFDPNIPIDTYRTTPLISAAHHNRVKTIEVLLTNGADLEQHSDTTTALTAAVEYGAKEACQLLLEKGADPHKALETAFEENKAPELCALIVTHICIIPQTTLNDDFMQPALQMFRTALLLFKRLGLDRQTQHVIICSPTLEDELHAILISHFAHGRAHHIPATFRGRVISLLTRETMEYLPSRAREVYTMVTQRHSERELTAEELANSLKEKLHKNITARFERQQAKDARIPQ